MACNASGCATQHLTAVSHHFAVPSSSDPSQNGTFRLGSSFYRDADTPDAYTLTFACDSQLPSHGGARSRMCCFPRAGLSSKPGSGPCIVEGSHRCVAGVKLRICKHGNEICLEVANAVGRHVDCADLPSAAANTNGCVTKKLTDLVVVSSVTFSFLLETTCHPGSRSHASNTWTSPSGASGSGVASDIGNSSLGNGLSSTSPSGANGVACTVPVTLHKCSINESKVDLQTAQAPTRFSFEIRSLPGCMPKVTFNSLPYGAGVERLDMRQLTNATDVSLTFGQTVVLTTMHPQFPTPVSSQGNAKDQYIKTIKIERDLPPTLLVKQWPFADLGHLGYRPMEGENLIYGGIVNDSDMQLKVDVCLCAAHVEARKIKVNMFRISNPEEVAQRLNRTHTTVLKASAVLKLSEQPGL